jgi:hypothetical protein
MEGAQVLSQLEALKTKLRATWIAGDAAVLASALSLRRSTTLCQPVT